MSFSLNTNTAAPLNVRAMNILLEGTQFASKSLSSFIDSEVHMDDFSVTTTDGLEFLKSPENSKVLLLKTELMGELGGINYFLLPIYDVMKICSKRVGKDEAKPMMIEFLKEMENVLAAAAITNIANQLAINIFGDVPKAQAIQHNEVLNTIEEESSNLPPKLVIYCQFNLPEFNIKSKYMWVFSEAMFQELQLMYN